MVVHSAIAESLQAAQIASMSLTTGGLSHTVPVFRVTTNMPPL
jgi:hypothetical protein